MSATQFTLGSSVPSGAGLVAYLIKNSDGTQSSIVVQQNATTLHPTQAAQSPWTIGYQVLDPKDVSTVLASGSQSVADASAKIDVGFAMTVDAAEAPAGFQRGRAGDGWTRLGDLPVGSDPAQLADPPANKSLAFAIQPQAQTQWCWAAVSSSVADYYAPHTPPDPSQCALASWAFSPNDCCASGGSSACNQPYLQSLALQHVGHRNRSFSGPMTFSAIQAEIVAERPIAVSIAWNVAGGHAVTITGYATLSGVPSVLVRDPGDGGSASWIPLSTFPAGGSWNWTVTTQA